MGKIYIGIDNGVSGSIGIIEDTVTKFMKTPVVSELDYTKETKHVTRVNVLALYDVLEKYFEVPCLIALERPMVNPGRWVATLSAIRCHEAMLVVFQMLNLPYIFIDSREWQKFLLPNNCDKLFLKSASLDVGNRLFPQFKEIKHPDRDGMLIAEYCKRKKL